MTDFEALAARCDAACGPNDDIDEAIMAVLFVRDERHIGTTDADTDEPLTDKVWVDPATNRWVGTHARGFTSSVDAALSLLPVGAGWNLQGNTTLFYAAVAGNYSNRCSNPALAICAAALRAKAGFAALAEAATAEPGSRVTNGARGITQGDSQ